MVSPKKEDMKETQAQENSSKSKRERDNSMKRVIGIDFSRGWGLFIVVVTHLFNYWGMEYLRNSSESPSSPRPLILNILSFLFLWQATWASAFAFFSGASVVFTIHYQLSKKPFDLIKRIKKSLINILVLFILNYIYTFFSIYPAAGLLGDRQYGMIPGSIRNGQFTVPNLQAYFIASPLTMILWSDVFVSLVCLILWRKGVDRNKHWFYFSVFLGLGFLFLYSASPIQDALIPIMHQSFMSERYGVALVLSWLVGFKFPVFPYVSYAFFGGIISLFLRQEKPNFKGMALYGYIGAAFFFTITMIYGFVNGFGTMNDWFSGTYESFFLVHLNMMGEMIWLTTSILVLDRMPYEKRKGKKRYDWIMPFQRLSMLSLTVFITEEIIAAIYSVITKLIFPVSIMDTIFFLVVWTAVYTFSWIYFLKWWEKKHHFKYSFEWAIAWLLVPKKFRKKQDLLGIEKIMYNPSNMERKSYKIITTLS